MPGVDDRRRRMLNGVAALRDATRALRMSGAARKGEGGENERGALFDLAALADRLASFAEDQGGDDWEEFWVTEHDVQSLHTHVAALTTTPRGLAGATLPTLATLVDDLAALLPTEP